MSPLTESTRLTLAKAFTWNETVWNPSMITTALWLDAADSSTVTTVSGAVSQWNDKSGNARHVAQSNSTLRPAIATTAQNGLNGIQFDGVNDFLTSSSAFPITGNPSFSVFSVHKCGSSFSQAFGWGSNSAARGATVFGASFAFLGGNTFFAATQPAAASTYQIGYTKAPGAINATSNLYLNGGLNNGTGHSTSTPNIEDPYSLIIGRLGPITNVFDDGIFFEIVILASTASTDTRQRIEGYLAWKWGLTANLPAGHPYKTVGPTP